MQPESLIEKNFHLANLLLVHMRWAGEPPSAIRTHLARELDRKKHWVYDESDESSLDGLFGCLLFERTELASAERLASLSACA
jgi:hypothetical protein